MGEVITILKNFPWVTAATGTYTTPWVHYPSELGDCEMITVVECMDTGTPPSHSGSLLLNVRCAVAPRLSN